MTTRRTRINLLFYLILIALSSMIITGCENKNSTQIEWMIPIEPSSDSHTMNTVNQEVPAWAKKPGMAADIILLSKNRAQTWNFHLTAEKIVHHRDVDIELLGTSQHLRFGKNGYIEDPKVINPAAFIRVFKQQHIIYQGWIYRDFPELFGLEDPEWQVWLKHTEHGS